MSFENAKNKLLGKWNKKYDINLNDYISGGIQDESSWLGSDFKVMYLVKDVNDCGNDFDKNKYFKDPDSSEMINTIIYWQKAINEARSNNYILGDRTLSWYKDLDLSVFDSLSIDEKKELLKQIAVICVKKPTSKDMVNRQCLNKFLQNYLELFNCFDCCKYRPSLIVGGEVIQILDDLKIIEKKEWMKTANGVNYVYKDGIIYLAFYHPNIRLGGTYLYFALRDAVNIILKKYSFI